MVEIISFGLEIMDILKPFFAVALPTTYDLARISGAFETARNVGFAFLAHALRQILLIMSLY